jgi:hypothetical protein
VKIPSKVSLKPLESYYFQFKDGSDLIQNESTYSQKDKTIADGRTDQWLPGVRVWRGCECTGGEAGSFGEWPRV